MAVFRVEKTRDYTVMANHHLKNKNLSLKAKGLLSVMLSLPDNWDYTLKGLSLINREGIDAIREAVRELERAGYVVRSRARDEHGRLRGSEYVIYERPQSPVPDSPAQNKPAQENPMLDNPTQDHSMLEKSAQEKPVLGNPMQLNTNRSNTNSSNTNLSIPHAENPYPSNPYPSSTKAACLPMDDVMDLRETVCAKICYESMAERFGRERMDEIVEIIVEVLASQSETITVSGVVYTSKLVKDRFRQLNSFHIEYIFNRLEETGSDIHNIKRYLITALFNAPSTIAHHYDALVRRDERRRYDWMDDLDG